MAKAFLHHSSCHSVLAKTALGTPINVYKSPTSHTASVTKSAQSAKNPIIFIGGVHGDEPEGVTLAQQFLDWLGQSADSVQKSWILIPCINPDGYAKKQRMNANGVDLNRNFPSTDWSPEHKAPRYFPGPKPASEPEVQALITLFAETKPRLIVHFHSWKPCVVYTGVSGEKAARIIGKNTSFPISEDIGYPTPGSLGQYGWLDLKIPVICVEAEDPSPAEKVWSLFGPGLRELMTGDY